MTLVRSVNVRSEIDLWTPHIQNIRKYINKTNVEVYLFLDKKKYPPITFEYSQEEIAAKAGIKVSFESFSTAQAPCGLTLHFNYLHLWYFIFLYRFWIKKNKLAKMLTLRFDIWQFALLFVISSLIISWNVFSSWIIS